jgi:hypothetical protein
MAAAESVARACVLAFYAYALAGIVFAIFFITLGVQRIDTLAKGSSPVFRLLLFPGSAALWPLLLRRWISGRAEPPVERSPHR